MNKSMKKFLVIAPIALLCLALTPLALANPAYLASATGSRINNGNVYNVGNIVGSGADGYYARIYGPSGGDGGIITGPMSTTVSSGSYIAIYAFVGGPASPMHVWVANSAGGPWTYVGNQVVTTGAWYYFVAPQSFTHIAVASYNPSGAVNLYIDCVLTM